MRAKMMEKIAETTFGPLELPDNVVQQRADAAVHIGELLDAVEAGEGERVDFEALQRAPFVTCIPGLGSLLSGWAGTS
jgi:hypothetical protein